MRSHTSKAEVAAGKLYKISTEGSDDPVERVFQILKFFDSAPLEQTLEIYRQIKNKWVTLAEIVTAKPLTANQKNKIEKYIANTLGTKICFLYEVEPKILGGLKVRVGDDVFDESILSKIRDLTIK